MTPPMTWLVIGYFGSLLALLVTAFWQRNSFTFKVEKVVNTQNFVDLFVDPVNRAIVFRTILMAAAVTITCVVLAVPTAFFIVKLSSPRARRMLVCSSATVCCTVCGSMPLPSSS